MHVLDDKSGDISEERTGNINLSGTKGLEGLISTGAKKAKQLAEKVTLKFNVKKQQATDKLFTKFRVGTVESNLFDSSQYQNWARSVLNTYWDPKAAESAIFTKLRSQYGDEPLAKLLAEAKAIISTKDTAMKLENVQFESWQNSGNTLDDVFDDLKLYTVEGNPFKNPLLDTWISYASRVQTGDPYVLLMRKLTKLYGEDGFASLIASAKRDYRHLLTRVASQLEATQLQSWLNEGKSADDIFKLLRLDTQEADDMLNNLALGAWYSHATSLNENPSKLLLAKLQTQYSDGKLASLIVAAREQPKAQIYVGIMASELLSSWMKADKSLDDVFKLLNLDKVQGDKLIHKPEWSLWESYASKVDEDNAYKPIFSVLKKHFGDAGLENIIVKASEDKSTKEIAAKLQEEMRRVQGITADEMFKILKLDQAKNEIFENPKLTGVLTDWVSYVDKLDEKTPFATISYLQHRFNPLQPDKDDELAMVLAKATTQSSEGVFKDLQEVQFKLWMNKHFDPDVVADKMARHPNDPRGLQVIVAFHDFYWANKRSYY
ncbi:RxLR effector protein [Phytophthora megakarya]|uniref:RxLR effector protein n=1 Tax=Phytophthora megakarya TaxID=4795 RepID=A0A225VZK3_9STRA|nr:RxLR effector protein [Phytophthora megakarya]